jgi:hypothetical protein
VQWPCLQANEDDDQRGADLALHDYLHLASNCTTVDSPNHSVYTLDCCMLLHKQFLFHLLRFWRFLYMIRQPHSVHLIGSTGRRTMYRC